MYKSFITGTALVLFALCSYAQEKPIEITNEIHYNVDIEYGRKTNRPNLDDNERNVLLATLQDGVYDGKWKATGMDPETSDICPACILTPDEFDRILHPREHRYVEDPDTGELFTVTTIQPYELDSFHLLQFIEEWDISEKGQFVKTVKAVGILAPIYDDANVLMGHKTLCHVWFE